MTGADARTDPNVAHFRQILLWPVELMPLRSHEQIQKHWDVLERTSATHPWREVEDEFTPDADLFQERHYSEFVTFLPYVQRFLYGEDRAQGARGESPIRVYRACRRHTRAPHVPRSR
jgi:hypothetical protein